MHLSGLRESGPIPDVMMAEAPIEHPMKKQKTGIGAAAPACGTESESSDEELSDMAKAVLIAAYRQPDMNQIEFTRTLSDDGEIKVEEIPLSDSELPPRRQFGKKKKKTGKSKSNRETERAETSSAISKDSQKHDSNVQTQSGS